MLINRGRYLALFGEHERAIAAFEQALALNPDLALARQGVAESMAQAPRP
jgi:tetratricopeptide (TPR) repeat protein